MHVAFATTEYDPAVPGGAGVLVAQLQRILEGAGHRVSIVLAAEADEGQTSVTVADAGDDAGWDLEFMATSKAVAEALADVHRRDPIDLVEVQDFDGLPFWLLTHRGDLGFAEIPVTVRFHGPVDLQVAAVGTSTADLDAAAVMERESYRMADAVTVPSEGIATLVIDRYGIDRERIRIGPPPVREIAAAGTWVGGNADFLVVGRLGEVKGSHDLVDAAVPVLRDHTDITVTFVGADGWSASAGRPMREWLDDRIPSDVADRIRFVGHVDAERLGGLVSEAAAVVAPSRFESFHLGVHEARAVGAPVIVPSIPAFAALLDGHGAAGYDGTVPDLERVLRAALTDGWARTLTAQPPPDVGDPLGPYAGPLPVPHHRRSQGGRATAAIARLEESWLEPRRAVPPSLGRRVLERMPAGVYAAGKRLVPSRLRNRLRDRTDLGVEADRRLWDERFARAAAALAERTHNVATPRVTVVIPCYNQGEFIREALLSVFEQSTDGIDVVIVDDGSDDGMTGPLLAGLDQPGVRVIRQDNAGLPAARNAGIAVAGAPLVVTLDADDMLAPDYVARLEAALGDDPRIAYAHCWAELVGDVHAMWATRPYNPYQLMLSNSVVGCVLLRKDAWSAVGGYDEAMRSGNEDWDLWIRLAAAGYGSVQVREPLFRYRKHGVSMSVETEARYEDALDDRIERHPELYDPADLTTRKATWYPLLTVLTDDGRADEPDTQTIDLSDEPLEQALDDVRGKYAVWLPRGSEVEHGVLVAMCRALEDDDSAGLVCTAGDHPVGVARTWSVFDPSGPTDVLRLDLAGSAPDHLRPGDHPRSAWQVPTEIRGVPVIRQRPEEAGSIPRWVSS